MMVSELSYVGPDGESYAVEFRFEAQRIVALQLVPVKS
jgi:hypothetical protein